MIVLIILIIVLSCFVILYLKTKRVIDPRIPIYPGKLPLLGHLHLFFGDSVYLVRMMHKFSKYCIDIGGNMTVSLGPLDFIVISDPDDAFAIAQSNPQKHYVYSFIKPIFGDGLVTADLQTWSRHKKLIYPMFAQQHINNFIGIFNKQARRLVERFAFHLGRGDFNHELDVSISGLETVCQTTLGTDVSDQINKNKEYVSAIRNVFNIAVTRTVMVWYHWEYLFNLSFLKRSQDQCAKVVNGLSNELLQKRRALFDPDLKSVFEYKDNTKPFIDHLLKAEAENADFNEKEIREHVNTIIVAGYDTAATAMIYCLMLLGHHRDVQQKVYNEIREVFDGSDRDVDKEDFPKLIYLEAVIKESLRLYPVVPITGRTMTNDIKLGNFEVKAGSTCVISILGLNRHPEWGPDADEFRPERWLDGTLPTNPNLWAPFVFGKRYCIGKTYAMMSMKTSIIHLLRHFELSSDISKLVLKMEVMLKPASGQHIKVEERKKMLFEEK